MLCLCATSFIYTFVYFYMCVYFMRVKNTYKSWEVVLDAVRCQPLAELGLLLQQSAFHLLHLFFRAGLVVAHHGRLLRLLKLSHAAHEHLLVHFLRWNHMACKTGARSFDLL